MEAYYNLADGSSCTLPLKSISPLASVWIKTTLNTGGVDGTWAGPQTCKTGTFFLMCLYVLMCFNKKISSGTSSGMSQTKISFFIVVKSGNFCLRHFWARLWWDFFVENWHSMYYVVIPRTKEKNVPVLQVWGSTSAPPTRLYLG